MTVIAYDGDLLVTDGRSTIGTQLVSDNVDKFKKFFHPEYGKVVAAFCGTVLTIEPWIDHIEEKGFIEFVLPGMDGPLGNPYESMGVMVSPGSKKVDATIIEFTTDGLWSTVTKPTAWGSGSTIAQHFLTTGRSALEAVREACRTELTCGGRIASYNPLTGEFKVHD